MELLPVFQIIKMENKAKRPFDRQPEPTAVMTGLEQSVEYSAGGEKAGPLFPVYLFHLSRIARLLKPGDRVLDLGCGTAQLLCMLANLCPAIEFVGLDLSKEMLTQARQNQKKVESANLKKLTNLQFIEGSMLDIEKSNRKFDAVISNFAIHHLPSASDLEILLREVRSVLKPEGAVYISDFLRPKSTETVELLADYSYTGHDSILKDDYRYSLLASFAERDFAEALAREPLKLRFSKTRFFSFIFFLQMGNSGEVPSAIKKFVRATRKTMPAKNQRDYWALRVFSPNN